MQMNMEQIMQMLANREPNFTEINKSIALDQQLISETTLNSYTQEIRKLFFYIFNPDNKPLTLGDVMPFQVQKTKMAVCNKLFSPQDQVYRCFQCFLHPAAVFCASCFEASEHRGHRYTKISSGGGNCDCGNPIAMKKEGFCHNHTGVTQIPEIPDNQIKLFKFYILHIFQWFAGLLKQGKMKSAERLGIILIKYLSNLNEESIYYNVMTNSLLTSSLSDKPDLMILDRLFKIKEKNLIKVICDLYFKMFSLQTFKYNLAKSFINSYNKIIDFQSSGFHCLYIQLFANDNIVLEISKRDKLTFKIQRHFNYMIFLEDLTFISTISEQPALEFLKIFFECNPSINYPYLEEVQNLMERSEMKIMHDVDLVSKKVNEQNYFYTTSELIIGKVKNNKELLRTITRGVYHKIVGNSFSYKVNKVVLPFHRVFSECLLALCEGDLEKLSLSFLNEILHVSQENIESFYYVHLRVVLTCILEFAQTYAKRSYFDNYLILYVSEGNTCINFDYLFIKQAAIIFKKMNKNFEQILLAIFQQNKNNKDGDESDQEFIHKWCTFIGLLIEAGVSWVPSLVCSQNLKINDSNILRTKQNLFCSLLSLMGPMNKEELKSLEKYFTGKISDEMLISTTVFEKNTKKYSLKNKEIKPLIFNFYPSKYKIQDFSQKHLTINLAQKSKENIEKNQLIPTMIPVKIINTLIKEIEQKIRSIDKEFISKILDEELMKLKLLGVLDEQFERMQLLSNTQRKISEQQSQKESNMRRQLINARKAEKLKKIKEKQKKVIESNLKDTQEKIQEQNEDKCCMICREDSTEDYLCYMGLLRKSNLMNLIKKQEGQDEFFTCCFHTAHLKCCQSVFGKQQRFRCPLCKSICNVMLPVPGEASAESIGNMMNRIQVISSAISANSLFGIGWSSNKEDKGRKSCLQIAKSFNELIGLSGVINEPLFDKKYRKIGKIILYLLKQYWRGLSPQQKELVNGMFLQYLQQLQKTSEMAEQTDEPKIIKSIQHCIISTIIQYLHVQKVDVFFLYKKYSDSVNYFDLKIIIRNILEILEVEPENNDFDDEKFINDQIKRVKDIYTFFTPPESIHELIKYRDNENQNKCKNSHNISVCVQCQNICCLECKTRDKHTKKTHGGQAMYFNLLTGGISFQSFNCKIDVPSLYENKIGIKWSAEKVGEGFMLDFEEYRQITGNLLTHSFENYIQIKRPDIMETRNNIFI